MEGITVGEIITLEDQKEFICFQRIRDNGKNYLFLMSNYKPLEVLFAEEIIDGGVLRLRKIGNQEEKERLMQLFGDSFPSGEKREPPKEPEQIRTMNGDTCEQGTSVGEMVTLENMGDFVCFRKIRDGGKEYLCLMSSSTPRQFVFAEEIAVNGVLCMRVVRDQEKLDRLGKLIRKSPWETIKQIFKRPKRQK